MTTPDVLTPQAWVFAWNPDTVKLEIVTGTTAGGKSDIRLDVAGHHMVRIVWDGDVPLEVSTHRWSEQEWHKTHSPLPATTPAAPRQMLLETQSPGQGRGPTFLTLACRTAPTAAARAIVTVFTTPAAP